MDVHVNSCIKEIAQVMLKNYSVRTSNFELCRIVSILLVVIGHAALYTQGDLSDIDTCWVPSLFLRGFTVVGVNVFVLISGWFGISVKKDSIKNLLYIVLFYGVLRCLAFVYYDLFSWKYLFVLSTTNWFVIAYLGLYILSPILNAFINNCSQRQFTLLLTAFFVYQVWMGWFPNLPYYEDFRGGYSILSFVWLYLLSRYMRLYGIPIWISKQPLLLYVVLSFGLGAFAWVNVKYSLPFMAFVYKYNNPIVILSSVSLFAYFANLQLGSISLVNHLAKSSLSVLLIHEPQPFHGYMKSVFLQIRDGGDFFLLIMKFILAIIGIYCFCVLIDQLRLFTYKLINKSK